MTPDGVAIFRKNFRGDEEPICFVWDSDLAGIEQAWKEAVEVLSAADAEELRRDGCFARLVSLNPLAGPEIGQPHLAEDCARLVEYKLDSNKNVVLKTSEARLPVDSSAPALPEFPVYVWDYFEDANVEVELNLNFVLRERTSTHAIYEIRDTAHTSQTHVKGKMASSCQSLSVGQEQKLG